jgi:transcriptional regulator with XRE-family HTH domain
MAPAKTARRTLPSLDRVIANQIRELRRKRGVSQQRLAELLGETQSTITRIESGQRSIAVSEVYRIAAVLDCAPAYLLSGGLTGEAIPLIGGPEHELSSDAAFDWIVGMAPLIGGNERAYYLENVSATRAADIAIATRLKTTGKGFYELLSEPENAPPDSELSQQARKVQAAHDSRKRRMPGGDNA